MARAGGEGDLGLDDAPLAPVERLIGPLAKDLPWLIKFQLERTRSGLSRRWAKVSAATVSGSSLPMGTRYQTTSCTL